MCSIYWGLIWSASHAIHPSDMSVKWWVDSSSCIIRVSTHNLNGTETLFLCIPVAAAPCIVTVHPHVVFSVCFSLCEKRRMDGLRYSVSCIQCINLLLSQLVSKCLRTSKLKRLYCFDRFWRRELCMSRNGENESEWSWHVSTFFLFWAEMYKLNKSSQLLLYLQT